MSQVQIQQVVTQRQRRIFLTFPWQVYREDPLWVPPLLPERKSVQDPGKGVFFQRGQADFFLAYQDGRPAGTICVGVDPPTNQARGKKECIFGFLEYLEDYQVFEALLEQAKSWARQHGLDTLYGPWNLDYEDSYGVLVGGRDAPPALMCGHSPPYYQAFMERYGFQPARAENVALRISLEPSPKYDRLKRLAARLRERGKITVREARFDRWQEEVSHVHHLLHKALAHLDDRIGWQRDALEATLEPFRTIADPACILFAESGGEVVGFLPGLPNLNEFFIKVNGLRHPWNTAHLLWLLKTAQPKSMTAKSILVLPEYWNRGVVVLLVDALLERAISRGYEWVDLSITSADNPTSVLTAEKLGAEIYKRWQVYQLPVA